MSISNDRTSAFRPASGRSVGRRHFLRTASGSAAALALPGGHAFAQQAGCGAVRQLILAAESPPMITLDPLLSARMRTDIGKAKDTIASFQGKVEDNRREQLLDYLELIGGAAIFLGGITFGLTLGPALIASVAFAGTVMVVRTVAGTSPMTRTEVIENLAGSRVPSKIEAAGEGVAVLSTNAAKYGKLAGNVAGGAAVIYSGYNFAKSTDTFQASTVQMQRLTEALEDLEAALVDLENAIAFERMRRDCVEAVKIDLQVVETNQCGALGIVRP